jgi:membrane protease YdiL (CAAX protease family)
MSFFSRFHPRRFFAALRAIDQESMLAQAGAGRPDHRPAMALFTAAFCLLFIHYLKYSGPFYSLLGWFSPAHGQGPGKLLRDLQQSGFFELLLYAWWGLWHVVGYVLIPLLVIRLGFRDSVREYGLRIGATRAYLPWCLVLAAPIVGFAVLASFREDFTTYYPFYRLAGRSWFDLIAWETIYLLQFVCLEFFFRGFLLHACKPAFGANAIFVMLLPYLMIHFPKPWLEATGAIFFGLFLGVLALRSHSIWGGVMVHASVALSMDLLAIAQTQQLPQRWWPS